MRIVCATSALSRVAVAFLFAMAFATGFAQQQTTAAPQLIPLPMPPDRMADSYEIYSQLLPGNQIEWGSVPRLFWLVEDTTKAHSLAMTQIGMYCGGLCGHWRWVALERTNGQWRILPWPGMVMMS